jgi:cytochrome P450 / NADPH-cytochrome P450 reductase
MDAIRQYHPMMLDIAVQLMQKWERLNPDDTVDVLADMTRLTLDAIALCGFNYRFNSFYRDTPHPFVVAMLRSLEAAQAQRRELPIQRTLNRQRRREVQVTRHSWFRRCSASSRNAASPVPWAPSMTCWIGC